MLPRIIAEESLRFMTAVALGTGSLKEHESQRILNNWNREIGGSRERPRLHAKDDRTALAFMGIGVEIVERKKKDG